MSARKKKAKKPNPTGRNDTEQFFTISYVWANSPAFRSLSGGALKVWIELRSRFNGRNNGRLFLSWDEAALILHMSKTTVGRAFDELEEKGFIVLTKRGQWYGRMASEYAITDRQLDGHLATNAWKHWRPPPKAKKQSFGTDTDHISHATGTTVVPKKKVMVR